MRSHAKAATAGSTQRQATGLGRFVRGALATRGASRASKGSGAPSAVRLVLSAGVFAALLALVLLVGSASAANGVVNFFSGNESQSDDIQGGKFSFSNNGPGGVAVNQEGTGGATAGDVYVVDRGSNRIQQFSASGSFIRAFGRDVGGAGVHVCTVAASCIEGTASAEAAGMNAPQGIAIDQANGNVYVTDQSNGRVDVYSANGTFQAAFGYGVDTGAAALELCTTASTCAAGSSGANAGQFGTQIGYPAIAPAGSPNAGHLYIADKSNRRVDQFEPTLTAGEVTGIAFVKGWGWGVDTGANAFEQCTTVSECQAPNTSSPTNNPGQFSSNQPQALAVDSNGNVYVAESSGNNRAQKFDSTGNPAAFSATELNGSPGPIDIAADKTTNRVYAIKEVSGTNEKRILEFSSTGAFLTTHASGTSISSANGFAHVQGTGNFYMSTSNGFSPPFFSVPGVFFLGTKVPPAATVEAPSPLGAHTATLKGKVNPQGFSTHYRFEFSSDGGSTWTKFPSKEGEEIDLGNGSSDVPVSQEVSGLIGGHEYRYRIVATKPFGAGTTTSSQQAFTAPASAPTVATFVSAVTTKAAVLNAEINPQNQATTYHFEYGTADCSVNPCTSVPVPDAGIGSGEAIVDVAKEVTGLQPDTTYHFRVVATNGTGTTAGPDTILHTYESFVPDTDCPNRVFRTGAAAALPDCRAYEMVSPVDKNGNDITSALLADGADTSSDQAALDGNKMTYTTERAFGDALSNLWSNQFIASRGADGWTTHSINPPHTNNVLPFLNVSNIPGRYAAFTEDLSKGFLFDDGEPALAPGALPSGWNNYYLRDNVDETYEPLTTQVFSPVEPFLGGLFAMGFMGYSKDETHTLFAAPAQLTPDAAPGELDQLYDFHDGELELVSILPNGQPATSNGTSAGAAGVNSYYTIELGTTENAISDDGSRIVWTNDHQNGQATGRIYVRVDGETTVPVSASVTPANNATYWTASNDGSQIIFSVESPIPGSDAGSLYRFDVDSETPTLIADEVHPYHGVLGASDDASYVYFLSKEALTAGAVAGKPNLYLDHEGAKTFIATLADKDESAGEFGVYGTGSNGGDFLSNQRQSNDFSRATPDGRHLVFQSFASLTGYDNTSLDTGEPAVEIYRYDADAQQLQCVSCNPSGGRPNTRDLPEPYRGGYYEERPLVADVAAWIPTPRRSTHIPRMLGDDGSYLFVNSFDALVPQDTNGVQDVYKWVEQGAGGCEEEDGCVSLISSGQGALKSTFIDASEDGRDVFFRTSESLDPDDPGLLDIYDARVGGGFAHPVEVSPCVGDNCQSVPAPPNDPTPASAAFRGAGDPAPGKARRSCRARGRNAKQSRAKHKKANKRCKRNNRRAGR